MGWWGGWSLVGALLVKEIQIYILFMQECFVVRYQVADSFTVKTFGWKSDGLPLLLGGNSVVLIEIGTQSERFEKGT